MITTCLQLLSLPHFKSIRLIAGADGLYRAISWPYVTITPSISEWLHGGELVFVTCSYYQTNENDMILFLKEALELKLSGVVVLQGGESLLEITPAICEYANEHQFPLFVMPWDMPIVDVVREISEMIISQKKQFDTKQRFFFEMLFSSHSDDKYDRLTTLYGLPKYRFAEVAIFHPLTEAAIESTDLLGKLSYHLQAYHETKKGMLIAEKHINDVVCFALADDEATIGAFEKRLTEFLDKDGVCYYPDGSIKLTFSDVGLSETPTYQLFEQANKTLKIILGGACAQNHMKWAEVGYRSLLFELSPERRKRFVETMLAPLANAPGSMDLLDTLRCYLDNNGNIVHTAQRMYLHKNTLSYRLNRIRDLLGRDLNAPDTRINMQMALDMNRIFPEDHYFS